MDFTREPIIETVITPRDGYRLVVRSSKNLGQEEHFVDAIEVVSFGNAFFFRCLERPKPFIVPLGDYEVLEVREPRMVLKTPSLEGSVKIGGGKDASMKTAREAERKEAQVAHEREREREGQEAVPAETRSQAATDTRQDRRRDRRRPFRRRRGAHREDAPAETSIVEEEVTSSLVEVDEKIDQPELPKAKEFGIKEFVGEEQKSKTAQTSPLLTSVLPPPTTLIRDDLARLRSNDLYKGAFYIREEKEGKEDSDDDDEASIEGFGSSDDEFEGGEQSSKSYEFQQFGLTEEQQGAQGVSQEDPFCIPEISENLVSENTEEDASKTARDMDTPF